MLRVVLSVFGVLMLGWNMAHASELPQDWKLEEIDKELAKHDRGKGTGKIYPLAWIIEESTNNNKTHRIERCLLMKAPAKEGETYFLANLQREPKSDEQRYQNWSIPFITVSTKRGTPGSGLRYHYANFEKKPDNKTIYSFLKSQFNVNWNFEFSKDANVVGCMICEKSWEEVIGEKPTQFFKR
jgi:hypothetical protein